MSLFNPNEPCCGDRCGGCVCVPNWWAAQTTNGLATSVYTSTFLVRSYLRAGSSLSSINPDGTIGAITDNASECQWHSIQRLTTDEDDGMDFTVDAGTDELTLTIGGFLQSGDPVTLRTTGTLPGGLVLGVTYYVINWDAPTVTFQLSTTPGGSAIDITDAGSGTHTVDVPEDGVPTIVLDFGIAVPTQWTLIERFREFEGAPVNTFLMRLNTNRAYELDASVNPATLRFECKGPNQFFEFDAVDPDNTILNERGFIVPAHNTLAYYTGSWRGAGVAGLAAKENAPDFPDVVSYFPAYPLES